MRIRTGRRNGHTLYQQLGDAPSDNDPFLGSCATPHYAAALVAAVNAGGDQLCHVRTRPPPRGPHLGRHRARHVRDLHRMVRRGRRDRGSP